jgi:alanyl-tRNA synthetase
MKSNEVRQSFLDYFAARGHKVVASSPLIPQNDPTLLFTNAGMNQFKNVFLGQERRDYKTATSSQKCLRAGGKHNDLENVGFTARHHTFFEMLGNFSFGDYFKAEAIAYAWEYVTRTLGLDPSRLYATVFTDDDEAERLWKKIAPELGGRVLRFGEHDNFWSMGETGPCGPCSEIHYDRGPQYDGELNGDGDRFMEIWNLVFMQYNRDENKILTPLPKPSVDTGAGLERFCMVLQDTVSNYETDLFEGLLAKVSELSNRDYSIGPDGVSHRVISDHVRALTFAIADGGIISNEGRGYVLRRILRRASRHGRLLGLHEPFLYKVVQPLVNKMGGHFTEIKAKQSHIELVIRSEEEQFGRTLDTGLEIFEDIIRKTDSIGSKVVAGNDVFRLYDTYGFPVDLTEVMAKERGMTLDQTGFDEELARQRERSKQESSFAARGVIFDVDLPKTVFDYKNEKLESQTRYFGSNDKNKFLILDKTPFYAESGGQIGDTGKITGPGFEFAVEDTQKQGDTTLHIGHVILDKSGLFAKSDSAVNSTVLAEINHERRGDIRRNHTATHLLHKALRMVLGEHVHQAGSLVAPERFRFDFTHFKAMTPQELDKVESIVNQKIEDDLDVNTLEDLPIDEAKKMGAMALFGEKYGDKVRVVKTGDFSLELCGGTHVSHTGDIENFFITQEAAIAAGMRRIEGITGTEASHFLAEQNSMIAEIKSIIKKDIAALGEDEISRFKMLANSAHRRILQKENLLAEIEGFISKVEKHLKSREREAQGKLAESATSAEPKAVIADSKILVYVIAAGDAKELMVFADSFKKAHPNEVVITISQANGGFAITSGDPALGKSVFSEVVAVSGGRGGGQGTIRGSMPADKIDMVIEALKRKFA